MLCNALSRYTSSPPAGGAVSLRLVSVAVPQAELRFSVSPGDRFSAAPLLRSPQGEAKVRVVPRGSRTNIFLPRIQKLSPLCTLSLLFVSPVLPVLRGFSGGGAALSSLCRRFPGGDIMNLTSRRNPLSGLSFLSFSFSEKEKRIGDNAVVKSLSENLIRQPPPIRHYPLQTSSALCRAATRRQSLRRCRRAL